MGLKGRVMELLRAGDERALGALASSQPRAIRFLLGRLWDPDEAVRHRAARALGVAAASHREVGRDLLRRLMWALNDESATNGLYGIPALAEIGYRDPELIRPFVAPLASLAWDDGLRPEILRALARIAEAAPELVGPLCGEVAEHVDLESQAEREALDKLIEVSGGLDES
jgi:hypothetical protein